MSSNSFQSKKILTVGDKIYHYYSLPTAEKNGLIGLHRLPFSLKILLENLLRYEDDAIVTTEDIQAFVTWLDKPNTSREIAYRPARVLMQDFTGVPAVVDLAAMRDAMMKLKGNPQRINPLCRVDLVIDHSVQVDFFGTNTAFAHNVEMEMQRNHERYTFLKWGQRSFDNFQVVPPGTGICHQVNLEYLASVVLTQTINNQLWILPDTLVGTDSHTTMINGLGVLGWGVGGIEAEAAMLGQPISMLIPEVIGFHLTGHLREGITATDLVLTITQLLRKKGVVGKFVEFFGPGLMHLSLADRATISNMAPEYGATIGFFPIDAETIRYLTLSGRPLELIELVEAYAKAQGLWYDETTPSATFTAVISLDLSTVEPSLAGPKRPQDRVPLSQLADVTEKTIGETEHAQELDHAFRSAEFNLHHGDVVIAAITSCTNTSNPSVMLAAGLLAKKAVEKGLKPKPWVKSSLAPGSKVVTDYLASAGLIPYLEKIGFYVVGYGCTTCIGNSGPLPEAVAKTITENDLLVGAVLSGNRNFEGRIHPSVKANWLASPPLVVAFALAGTTRIDLNTQPLGENDAGEAIFLKDIWPSSAEIAQALNQVQQKMFRKEYSEVFQGDKTWQQIPIKASHTYEWQLNSTYVQNPPYFSDMSLQPAPIKNITGARILAILGDSVTTDHISPAGAIKANSPAGKYLTAHGVAIADFNSYGSRRGNHEVMMRGTFANIRIRNEILPGVEGGYTKYFPHNEQLSIYDAAMKYQQSQIPLIIIAGQEYGSGSSRDWAAKGPRLLGVNAVIAESFERIHRSNLIGMGILPLLFPKGIDRKTLKLRGDEIIDFPHIEKDLKVKSSVVMLIQRQNGERESIVLQCGIDTQNEMEYYRHGGILPFVLRKML